MLGLLLDSEHFGWRIIGRGKHRVQTTDFQSLPALSGSLCLWALLELARGSQGLPAEFSHNNKPLCSTIKEVSHPHTHTHTHKLLLSKSALSYVTSLLTAKREQAHSTFWKNNHNQRSWEPALQSPSTNICLHTKEIRGQEESIRRQY